MEMRKLLERAKRIEAVALDSDGVFFEPQVFTDRQDEVFKLRSFYDGAGILLLLAAGIRVAFITREMKVGFLEASVAKLNSIAARSEGQMQQIEVFSGVTHEGKTETLQNWLREMKVPPSCCLYMGDDVFDFHTLKWIKGKRGLAIAPQQAEEVVKRIAHLVTPRRGGNGAIRDVVNLILDAKGIDPTKLVIPA